MASRSQSYAVGDHNQSLFGPIGISLAAHLLLVGLALFSPVWDSEPEFLPSVIDVQMVDLSDLNAAPVQKKAAAKEKAPVVKEKEAEVEVGEQQSAVAVELEAVRVAGSQDRVDGHPLITIGPDLLDQSSA